MNYSIEHKDWSTTVYKTLAEANQKMLVSDKCISLTSKEVTVVDSIRQDTSRDW